MIILKTNLYFRSFQVRWLLMSEFCVALDPWLEDDPVWLEGSCLAETSALIGERFAARVCQA